jgi:predicted nucleic acid-binding protein
VTSVFLDTSGLIALVNTDDQWHRQAETVWAELSESAAGLITSSLILIELADGLSRVHHRGLAIQLVDALERSSRVEIVQVDEPLERLGWQLFRLREDKNWGMTDCVSMSLMTNRQVQNVFTADHHFEQAGFNILLRELRE